MRENLFKLIDSEFDIKAIQSQRVKFIDGTSSRIGVFLKSLEQHLTKYLTDKERLEYADLNEKRKSSVVDKIVRKVVEIQEDARLKEEIDNADFNLEGLEILVELVDEEKEIFYIYDKEIEDISEIKYANLKRLVPQKQFNYLQKTACKSVYEPYAADENFNEITIGHRPVTRVNNYKHPEWRVGLDSSVGPVDLPALAQEFFEHLFPDPESLEYVYDWMYTALTARQGCEHILVLNGPTGTGKTIFSTQLMISLFKETNWGSAPKNLFDSTFNKVLKDKRIIFIDEANINERDYNTVKLYANKKLNIEKKGVDADNVTDLYYSMILSNNKMGKIYVDPDDRRFSIVETTSIKLLDVWSDSKVNLLVDMLKELNFIGKIGTHIIQRHDSHEVGEDYPLKQFRGPKFYQFIWRHLAQWQKIVCNRVFRDGKEGEDVIELDKLRVAIKNDKHIKYDVQLDTIIEFLQTYHHEGLHKLGEIVVEDKEQILQIHENWIKKDDSDELNGTNLL